MGSVVKKRRLISGTDPEFRLTDEKSFLTAIHRLRKCGFVAMLVQQPRFIPDDPSPAKMVSCLRYKNGTPREWYPTEAIWFAFLRKPGEPVLPGDALIPHRNLLQCHLSLFLKLQAATEAYPGYDPVLRTAAMELAGFSAGSYLNLY